MQHVHPILAAVCCLISCAFATGAAQAQADPPLTSTFIYDANLLANLRGGAARGSSYQGLLRWQSSFDAEKALGWSGTSAYLNVMAAHRAGRELLTGDAQGVDNIAAPSGVRMEEAWVQHNFWDNRLSLLAGRYDLNSEFYRLNSAGLFLNSSFGIGAELASSGQGGPSIYPATALGMRVEVKPAPGVIVRAALLDGAPVDRDGGAAVAPRRADGALLVVEVAWVDRQSASARPSDHRFLIGRASGLNPYRDKLAVGAWHYTASFDDLSALDASGNPQRRHGSSGAYLVADKLLYEKASAPGRLAGFVQVGVADARVNRFDAYLGVGVVATGLVPGRPGDEIGLALASARNGRHYLQSQSAGEFSPVPQRAETTLELAYLAQITPKLSLAPNLQYVIHPDTVAGRARALTFQMRAELAF